MAQKNAIIVGAGPAGLTAAYELAEKSDIKPIIFEKRSDIGGLSRTVERNGNRFDIGGHRFFSRSRNILKWWLNFLPIDDYALQSPLGKHLSCLQNMPSSGYLQSDDRMLICSRVSRILYEGDFFDYPLTFRTFFSLDKMLFAEILFDYLKVRLFPRDRTDNLEEFFIASFGERLYEMFFKDYTKKVWGLPCKEIPADWGRERVKTLSLTKVLKDLFIDCFYRDNFGKFKNVETSLVREFLYPKFGPGQLWSKVAGSVLQKKGEIFLNHTLKGINQKGDRIVSMVFRDEKKGVDVTYEGDYFFSSAPIRDVAQKMTFGMSGEVANICMNLRYRGIIVVGLFLERSCLESQLNDNWIYVQEKKIQMGRLQVFNNWSPYLVKEKDHVLLGAEYFCEKGDFLWNLTDESIRDLALRELAAIKLVNKNKVLDWIVIKEEDAYPSYGGAYRNFGEIIGYFNNISNLFLVGRNGMHRYNNMDHSMLSSMVAVENILKGITTKENIWDVGRCLDKCG